MKVDFVASYFHEYVEAEGNEHESDSCLEKETPFVGNGEVKSHENHAGDEKRGGVANAPECS